MLSKKCMPLNISIVALLIDAHINYSNRMYDMNDKNKKKTLLIHVIRFLLIIILQYLLCVNNLTMLSWLIAILVSGHTLLYMFAIGFVGGKL